MKRRPACSSLFPTLRRLQVSWPDSKIYVGLSRERFKNGPGADRVIPDAAVFPHILCFSASQCPLPQARAFAGLSDSRRAAAFGH
jgi:hypothetical protein